MEFSRITSNHKSTVCGDDSGTRKWKRMKEKKRKKYGGMHTLCKLPRVGWLRMDEESAYPWARRNALYRRRRTWRTTRRGDTTKAIYFKRCRRYFENVFFSEPNLIMVYGRRKVNFGTQTVPSINNARVNKLLPHTHTHTRRLCRKPFVSAFPRLVVFGG